MHVGQAGLAMTDWGGDASSAAMLGALACAYALGTRRVWRRAGIGHGVRRTNVLCFATAMTVLSVALLSPIDGLADVAFSAHMTQHVLLAVVAPPLLVLGAPNVALLFALPAGGRRLLSVAMAQPPLASAWRVLSEPFIACALHAAALWMWHAPKLYLAALDDAFLHFLEHASFVATATLLWWSILNGRQPRRAAYATGILVLFATTLQSGALGALLTFSGTLWFPAQDAGAAVLGMTPLQDQQVAGLIMWVPGGVLYTVAMAVLFGAWMRQLDRVSPSAPVIASS